MSCDSLPPPTPEEVDEGVSGIAKAVGAQSCSTASDVTEFSTVAEAELKVPMASGRVSLDTDFTDTKTSTLGCEQLFINANKFAASNKRITCMLSKMTNAITSTTSAVNSIVFDVGKDFVGQNITFNQSINVKIIDVKQLDNIQKAEIASEVKTATLTAVDAVQKSKSGLAATPQGSKICIETKNKIENESLTNIVDETINEIDSVTQVGNTIVFKVAGNMTVKGDLKIDQDIILDITATQILSSSVDKALSEFVSNLSEVKTTVSQAAENLGVESIGGKAGRSAADRQRARNEGQYGIFATIAFAIVVMYFLSSKVVPGKNPNDPQAGASIFGFALGGASAPMKWGGLVLCLILLFVSGYGMWWAVVGFYNQYDQDRAAYIQNAQKCLALEGGTNPPASCSKEAIAAQKEKFEKPPGIQYQFLVPSAIGILLGCVGLYFVYRLFTGKPESSGEPAVVGTPPVAGTPSVVGTPPVAGTPSVAGTPVVAAAPSVAGAVPAVAGAPSVAGAVPAAGAPATAETSDSRKGGSKRSKKGSSKKPKKKRR